MRKKKKNQRRRKRHKIVAGLDEAGRGPFAGPVVCSAVVFRKRIKLPGLTDSKLLSVKKREEFFKKIIENAYVGIGKASNLEIDRYGLIKACEIGFKRALKKLGIKPHFLLIDGNDKFNFKIPFKTIIRGDRKVRAISAASVIAKVYRDGLMRRFALRYPQYKFDIHKGYGTRMHGSLIRKHGLCRIHRKSFSLRKI